MSRWAVRSARVYFIQESRTLPLVGRMLMHCCEKISDPHCGMLRLLSSPCSACSCLSTTSAQHTAGDMSCVSKMACSSNQNSRANQCIGGLACELRLLLQVILCQSTQSNRSRIKGVASGYQVRKLLSSHFQPSGIQRMLLMACHPVECNDLIFCSWSKRLARENANSRIMTDLWQ